jgi:hypothetical protein
VTASPMSLLALEDDIAIDCGGQAVDGLVRWESKYYSQLFPGTAEDEATYSARLK